MSPRYAPSTPSKRSDHYVLWGPLGTCRALTTRRDLISEQRIPRADGRVRLRRLYTGLRGPVVQSAYASAHNLHTHCFPVCSQTLCMGVRYAAAAFPLARVDSPQWAVD